MRLDAFGVAGVVRHTPGHTGGSVAVLLDSGEASVGDLLMGGYLGCALLPHRPMYQYFAENVAPVTRGCLNSARIPCTSARAGHSPPTPCERAGQCDGA